MKLFSRSWISSSKRRKQRKYRANAPIHIKRKLMSSALSKELRLSVKKKSIPIRVGDQVKVLRGSFKGKTGKVTGINRGKQRIYVSDIEFEKKDGTKKKAGIDASKLIITKLNLDDKRRLKKHEA